MAAWRGVVRFEASSSRRCDLTTLTTHILSEVSLLHSIRSLRIVCMHNVYAIERLPSEGILASGHNLREAAPSQHAFARTATRVPDTMRWQLSPGA
jgi:hypothetical protein